MTLTCFELKRFIKNPKNKICLAILVLFFLVLFGFNQLSVNQQFKTMTLASTTTNLQQTKQSVAAIKTQVASAPEDTMLAKQLILSQEQEKMLSEQLKALTADDLDRFATLAYEADLAALKSGDMAGSDDDQNRLNSSNYYLAVKAVGGKMGLMANDAADASFKTGSAILHWLSATTLLVLITVLISDVVSADIESSQIRFYQLIGGRKFRQLVLKLLLPIGVVGVVTVLTFAGIYLISGLLIGFGTWHYPYSLTDGRIFPIWQLSLKSLGLFLVSLLFIGSMGQLLSLIFKKSLVVIGLIVVCLTGFLTLEREVWFQPFKKFIPFEYLGYGRLINDIKILPDHFLLIGVVYLVGLSLIFLSISAYLYHQYYYRKVGKL
ncbi:ABC transporter permease [Lactococcus piscium]|uniref:ABC transporter permease n=1 Tax=Pseudolactococcus carnosus TaxID=2749961 RepID=UPI0008127CD7|nr:ABC transporter permease [Lactococcus carnosus]MCJ1975073.1 ABC transporter permease [Lactococcus carnosus]MCJ1985459.1 ABC transporter permease [Lactococcus carnosus]SCA90945.1 ABC-2 family transporter protein [Lactococcus piscium]